MLLSGLVSAQKTERLLGTISSNGAVLPKVEVVNETKKTIVLSEQNGRFSIDVSENDVLYFLSKKCVDTKIVVSKSVLDNADWKIDLQTKTIDLDEVEIVSQKKMGVKVSYADITNVQLAKEAARPQNGIYTGQIKQGMDFIQIGRMIGKLFKKKKIEVIEIDFKKSIKANFETMFFLKTMNLKVEQINLFLEFCDADPKAKEVVKTNDVLTVMDFLLAKRMAFRKL